MPDLVDTRHSRWLLRLVVFVCAIYVFLGAIELLGNAFELIGEDAVRRMFAGLSNPFAGLAVGILATAILQSSSATTSMVVVMVFEETLPLRCAVPIIMGANIGTSVTCAIVSLGHITRRSEFQSAFAGATVHGFINLLTVVALLPLELATRFMERGAQLLVTTLPLARSGQSFKSPIKAAVKELAEAIQSFFCNALEGLGLHDVTTVVNQAGEVERQMTDPRLLAVLLSVVSLALILGSLIVITKNMKALMANQIEEWLNRVFGSKAWLGLAVGALVTMVVQSSSITTSLLVPMFGSGVLAIEAGFPIMLGANLGTTITALLAASVTGPLGLTIALVHVQFNTLGAMIFFPIKQMRSLPISCARALALLASRNRLWVVAYMLGVFVLIPLLGIVICE